MHSKLPSKDAQWRNDVKQLHLEDKTLFTLDRLHSASKIEFPQFLMLRVLYEQRPWSQLEKLFEQGAVTDETWATTNTCLRSCQEYLAYIKSIPSEGKAGALGAFKMARLYQKRSSELINDWDESRQDVDSSKITIQRRVTRSQTRAQQQASPTRKRTDVLSAEMDKLTLHTPERQPGGGSSSSGGGGEGGGEPRYLFSPTSGTPIPSSIADKVYRFIEDEQIVNFALVLLLDSLNLLSPNVEGFWSPYRSPFSVSDGTFEVYQARVDGIFRPMNGRPGNMIVEVKPHSRDSSTEVNVNMQESAQMAAWIAEYPDLDKEMPLKRVALKKRKGTAGKAGASPQPAEAGGPSGAKKPAEGEEPKRQYRRVLISQNRRQVYLTIGSYDSAYINYIKNVEHTETFLKMDRYGPFEIVDPAHMERLCHYLLALCIQGRILN